MSQLVLGIVTVLMVFIAVYFMSARPNSKSSDAYKVKAGTWFVGQSDRLQPPAVFEDDPVQAAQIDPATYVPKDGFATGWIPPKDPTP